MRHNRRILSSIVEIILGMMLMIACAAGSVDSYWSGMGGALVAVGTIFLFRDIKYRKDPVYKEKVDTATGDERNKFLGIKAWSWTGYTLLIILAFAGIGCKIAGQDGISLLLSGIVCLMIALYWLFYFFLSRKY